MAFSPEDIQPKMAFSPEDIQEILAALQPVIEATVKQALESSSEPGMDDLGKVPELEATSVLQTQRSFAFMVELDEEPKLNAAGLARLWKLVSESRPEPSLDAPGSEPGLDANAGELPIPGTDMDAPGGDSGLDIPGGDQDKNHLPQEWPNI